MASATPPWSISAIIPKASCPPPTIHFPLHLKSCKSPNFLSRPPRAAVDFLPSRPGEEDDEEDATGDCLVYEEGIFDDPFLGNFSNHDAGTSRRRHARDKAPVVSPENLIPDEWLDVKRELNMTKKERKSIYQEMEYGRKLEKRRQSVRPVNLEEYEKFKREKLKQLNPLVLDNPEQDYVAESKNQGKGDDNVGDGDGERIVRGRVAPRNPRLAVYGGGLEDISATFSSGDYNPSAAADKLVGRRKLFSKEEKLLLNRRAPDLVVCMSGKWHPLHTLVASGEFYLVTSLLKHSLDINAFDKNGLTAIHKAILAKKQAVFNFLLRESANPFVRDSNGATLMHYAVLAASSHMIKILLLYNVDVNLQDNDGWTPLHLAIQSCRTDIVRLLLIKGADKSIKNKDGLTALDLCLYSGRDIRSYELIKVLLRKRKAEKNLTSA